MTSAEIIVRMLDIVRREREVTAEAIETLRLIDVHKIYAERGYSSIWEFATKFLGYSEGAAYRRVSAMRLIKAHPEVCEKLKSGKLTLTNAAKAQTFLRRTKLSGEEVLRCVENKSSREAELSLLNLAPDLPRPEKLIQLD